MVSPLRVLIVCLESPYSGVGVYTRNLVDAIQSSSEVHYFVLSRRSVFPPLKEAGKSQIHFGMAFELSPFDLVFNSYFFPIVYRQQMVRMSELRSRGWLIHFTHGIKLPLLDYRDKIVTIHDVIPFKHPQDAQGILEKHMFALLRLSRHYRNVIVDSNHVRQDLMSMGFDANIDVIYPAVSNHFRYLNAQEELRRELGLPQGKKLILSVTTDTPRKNVKTIYETLKELGSDFVLVKVGLPAPGVISFQQVTDEFLNKLYNACDLLLCPSFDEGFGYPAVEAMAAGLPVVASDIEIFRETIGGSAILVEPTVQGCIGGVKEALETREKLRQTGLVAARKYSTEAFARNIKAYYEKVLMSLQ